MLFGTAIPVGMLFVWPVVHINMVLARTVGCTLLFSDGHQNSQDPRRL
jgi:hypothetical protein